MVPKGESIAPLGSLKDVGVVAVTDCPNSPANNEIFTNAIKYAKMFGLAVIDFPQDSYLSKNSDAHESPLSLKMGLAGNPRMSRRNGSATSNFDCKASGCANTP